MRILPGSVGVVYFSILSVSLEEMDCEPILNLAATRDEAVSIIWTIVEKLYLQLFGGS
jgi:hypothetical protein